MEETYGTPWHLWLVALLGVIWHGLGAYDFAMIYMGDAAYIEMTGIPQSQLDYIAALPDWTRWVWGGAIVAGLFGSLLLFLRSRFAVPLFWLSLLAQIANAVQNYYLSDPNAWELMGVVGVAMTGAVALVTLLLIWYSSRQRDNWVLD